MASVPVATVTLTSCIVGAGLTWTSLACRIAKDEREERRRMEKIGKRSGQYAKRAKAKAAQAAALAKQEEQLREKKLRRKLEKEKLRQEGVDVSDCSSEEGMQDVLDKKEHMRKQAAKLGYKIVGWSTSPTAGKTQEL